MVVKVGVRVAAVQKDSPGCETTHETRYSDARRPGPQSVGVHVAAVGQPWPNATHNARYHVRRSRFHLLSSVKSSNTPNSLIMTLNSLPCCRFEEKIMFATIQV